jgi:ABC-2 type transport system ATP-binding protein
VAQTDDRGEVPGGRHRAVELAATSPSFDQLQQSADDRFVAPPLVVFRGRENRQKVALVAALAAQADLLILDEPTSGLDPLMEQAFQQCVRERRRDGVTVLLSSHILGEVEALADRVSIIRRCRTVTTGSLADLRRHTRTSVHAVTAEEPDGVASAQGWPTVSANGCTGRSTPGSRSTPITSTRSSASCTPRGSAP